MPKPTQPWWRAYLAVWGPRLQHLWDVLIAPTLSPRTLVLGGLGLYLLARDLTAAKSFLFTLGLVAVVLAVLHWYRKTQQPYLDRERLISIARAGGEAAAMPCAVIYCASVAFDLGVLAFFLFAGLR
jgi:hypothetical protein